MKRVGEIKKQVMFDRVLIIACVLLLMCGIILISSASVMEATTRMGDEYYYLKRQLMYVGAGLVIGLIVTAIPTKFYDDYTHYPLIFSIILLVVVLLIGREINEAKRWIELGSINIQPAELLKLSWIIYFSGFCSRRVAKVHSSLFKLKGPSVVVFIVATLLLLQPDYGSFVVCIALLMALLFIAHVRLRQYLLILGVTVLAVSLLAVIAPYRVKRLTTFLDPWQEAFGSGYQLTQSLMAFGRGGFFGEGLGNSLQKLGYLPEAHTDFVTSIFGEEFGFVGMCFLLLLEMIIVFRAVALSFRILSNGAIFQGYMAFAIGVWIALQTVINIGVASGALPTKGLTLPFISYGGSSLFVTMAAMGILLRIDFEWRAQIIQNNLRTLEQKEKNKLEPL